MEVGEGQSSREGIQSAEEEGDGIFEALNFDPQLFINDVRNAVDDAIREGFGFFQKQSAKILGVEDEKMSKNLYESVDSVQCLVQLKLDKQLDIWEKYCFLNCFAVPEGLVLPEMNDTGGSLFETIFGDRFSDEQLDIQLDSLRKKLVSVGSESAKLHRMLGALENQSATAAQHAEILNEALRPLEEKSTHDVIKEIIRTSSELYKKMELLKTERGDKMENLRLERIRSPDLIHSKGNLVWNEVSSKCFQARMEDLQQFAANFKGLNQN